MRVRAAFIGTVAIGVVVATAAPAAATRAQSQQIIGLDSPLRVAVGSAPSDPVTVTPADTSLMLQSNASGQWQDVRRFRPDLSGAITIQYPTAELGTQEYRLVPSTPPGDPAMVDVIGYEERATVSGWPKGETYIRAGEGIVRRVEASPPGALAELQARDGDPWQTLSSSRVHEDGTLRLDLGKAKEGATHYRVLFPQQELVEKRTTTKSWTVVGYRIPPAIMLPDILNRLVRPLGIPRVSWQSVSDGDTARAVCVARELSGMKPSRSRPSPELRGRWLRTQKLRKAPRGAVPGVNVSLACQAAYFVQHGKVVRAVPVSSGRPGYPTNKGTYRIYRAVNGTETSNLFPEDHWNMYRSLYFHGGEALHGSYRDEYVRTYPDSHGCVRMLHKDVDWLWRNGWTLGTTVRVYGSWR